ncbi:MAG: carboxypeptidase-like regulatory domain-containing protein, partial [Saprospiraceae bacterium]|nr:carboxypeptidase-like regulatory domain-containing protein [Saprospiraceae bacterium]
MNKIKSTLLAMLLAIPLSIVFGQNATLAGLLTEAKNGEPLVSATVQAGETGTITDLNGRYEL